MLAVLVDPVLADNKMALAAFHSLPWSQRFFLIFLRMKEPRSGENNSRIGEKEKPLVTFDLNLTVKQTPGSGSDPRPWIG